MTSKSTTWAHQAEQAPAWMQRLKTAYDAGYYRTESSVSEQIPIRQLVVRCDACPYCGHNYGDIRRLRDNACTHVSSANRQSHDPTREQQKGISPWWRRWLNWLKQWT